MESRPDGRRILLSAISFYDIASDLYSDFSKGFEEELEDSADDFRIGEKKGRSIVSYEEVERESNDPDQWTLSVDIVDAYKDGELNKKDLVFSLVHELGHILTLGPDQIDINTEELEPDCGRRFDSGDGCAKELSYLRLPKDRAKTFQNHGQTLS